MLSSVARADVHLKLESLQVTHSFKPRGMVNAGAFGKMKKGAYIVNTARGPLIDETALVKVPAQGTLILCGQYYIAEDTAQWLEDFARAGADVITVHAEASVHLQRTLAQVRETDLMTFAGLAGLALVSTLVTIFQIPETHGRTVTLQGGRAAAEAVLPHRAPATPKDRE